MIKNAPLTSTAVKSALAGVLGLLFSGCMTITAATWGSAPDLSIVALGASRSVIENVLGAAVTRNNNVYTYEYNTRGMGAGSIVLGALADAAAFGTSIVYWRDIKKAYEAQRERISLVYGPRDTVISTSHEAAKQQYMEWLHHPNQKDKLELLCEAASAGVAEAQSIQGMRYWYGLWETKVDPVQASMWLRLAAFGGVRNAVDTLTDWSATMTPDDVGKSERLFAVWEPEMCER